MVLHASRCPVLIALLGLFLAGAARGPAAYAGEEASPREQLITYVMRHIRGIDFEKSYKGLPGPWDDEQLTADMKRIYRSRALHHIPGDLTAEEYDRLTSMPSTWGDLCLMTLSPEEAIVAWANAQLLTLKANLCEMRNAVKATDEERAAYAAAVDRYLGGFTRQMNMAIFHMLPQRIVEEVARRYRMQLMDLLYMAGLRQLTVPDTATVDRLRADLARHLEVKAEETIQAMGVIKGEVTPEQITTVLRATTGKYHFDKWLEEPLRAFYTACGWRPGIQSHCGQIRDEAQAEKDRMHAILDPIYDPLLEAYHREKFGLP